MNAKKKNHKVRPKSGGLGKMVNCEECGVEFYIGRARIKNKYHTCSKACLGKHSSKLYSRKIEMPCKNCGRSIFYKKSHYNKIKHHTCSVECRAQVIKTVYRGDGNPKSLKLSTEDRIFHDKAADARYRSEAKGLACDITGEFLKDLFYKQNGRCHYTGMVMKLRGKSKKDGAVCADFDVISLDKIDPRLGYLQNNVVFCINCVNMLKGSHSLDQIKQVFKAFYCKEHSVIIKTKKLYPDSQLPTKSNPNAAGSDLYVHSVEDCGHYIKVHTGIAIQPVGHYWFMLCSRSSAHKKGLSLYNGVGIIDMDYTGEIIGIFLKDGSYTTPPQKGERLLQIIPQQQIYADIEETDDLGSTERGSGGFGSTGK